jgi:hypothetical protein
MAVRIMNVTDTTCNVICCFAGDVENVRVYCEHVLTRAELWRPYAAALQGYPNKCDPCLGMAH